MVDKVKIVYPFYESVIIKKPKKVNVEAGIVNLGWRQPHRVPTRHVEDVF